jgi:hypothetical protein
VPRFIFLLSFFFCLFGFASSLVAQRLQGEKTPAIHYEFPFQTMWDDAVMASTKSGKPAVVFDLDLADSASIKLATTIIRSNRFHAYVRQNFEAALNDFAADPPPSVGLDSLRNLGWRLSGLEKTYGIAKRPCIIVIGKDKAEMDRIAVPQVMNATQLERQLYDILNDRNTLHSAVVKFWKDTTDLAARWKLIDMFALRSRYDSSVRHLSAIRSDKVHLKDARRAWLQLADLRLHIEGVTEPSKSLIASLSNKKGEDTLGTMLIEQLIFFYQQKKIPDSVVAMYDLYYKFKGKRTANILNEEAWYLATSTSMQDLAMKLINEAIAINPKDANLLDTRALIHANLEEYDRAIKDEQHAVSIATQKDKPDFEKQLQYLKTLKQQAEAEAAEEVNEETKEKK